MQKNIQSNLFAPQASLLVVLLLCNFTIANSQERKLLITTEPSFPSTSITDNGNTIFGQTADKVHEILKRSHIPYDMQMMSWNRSFELARNDANTCVFATARTKEREAQFKWVGPISKGEWAIFGLRNQAGKVTRLEDIKNANIGGVRGDVLAEYLVDKGYHVITSSENEISLKNVALGRMDYWVTDSRNGANLINKNHLENKIVLLFTIPHSTEYYLACNLQLSDDLMDRMKSKLMEIKADGTEAKIDAKYLNH